MRDFDEARNERLQRERTFKIGGEEFIHRASVAPETLIAWDSRGGLEGQDFIDVIDETIVTFLEPGQEEKWASVRNPNVENPLNIGDLIDVIEWLFEEQTERTPTGQSSGSTNGREPSGTPSTADSSESATPVA